MIRYATYYLKDSFNPINVPENIKLEHGQLVLVRTEKGEEAVKVVIVCPEVAEKWENAKNKPEPFEFVRKMSQRDIQTYEDIQKEEVTSFFKCKALIEQHKLNMVLTQCRLTFDKRKITFYYTAPERVDFRGLLKDLTQTFKRVRIDLRHIGVRDETSIMKGCGCCGQPFCCNTFKRKFEPINVKLARDQGMPISPTKISGTCGRLLCCLTYEYSNYINAAKGMPPIGSSVMTPEGLGRVCFVKFLTGQVAVKLEDGKIYEYQKSDVEMVDADVDIDINVPNMNNFGQDEKVDMKQLKQLEDDRNSSTGNV
ncbi:stage 0 sporulation protein [bacterium]|nr:stage 0 sporulation protein [bacterium]